MPLARGERPHRTSDCNILAGTALARAAPSLFVRKANGAVTPFWFSQPLYLPKHRVFIFASFVVGPKNQLHFGGWFKKTTPKMDRADRSPLPTSLLITLLRTLLRSFLEPFLVVGPFLYGYVPDQRRCFTQSPRFEL